MENELSRSYYTVKEVSDLTGKTVNSLCLHRHKKTGLPFQQLGRAVLYVKKAVDDYVELNKKIKVLKEKQKNI